MNKPRMPFAGRVAAVLVAVAVVVVATAAGQRTIAAAEQEAAPVTNPVFARNMAGTWHRSSPSGVQFLQNIHADGTLLWSHNFEYGGGFGTFLDGAVYGTWQQTGRHQMRSVELGFLYDGDGVHELTGRVSITYTFSPDYSSYTAEFWEDVFTPDQDPTDPNEEPEFSFGGTFAAKRVTLSAWTPPTTTGASDLSSRPDLQHLGILRPYAGLGQPSNATRPD